MPPLLSTDKMPPGTKKGDTRMDQNLTAKKTCPECGSGDYVFRGRKKLTANPEKGEPEQWETKRHCRSCGKEWKEKEPLQKTSS
jgi:DNA-directed RNA polymerase subunit M/transcription elongation factor TFIIS